MNSSHALTSLSRWTEAHAQCGSVQVQLTGEVARIGSSRWIKYLERFYCAKENNTKMVYHSVALPLICFTTLWALVGGVAPFFVPKGPNRG